MLLYSPSKRSRSTSSNSFFSLFGSKVQSSGPWAKLGNVNTNYPLLFLLVYLKSEKEASEIPEDNLVSHVLSWRQSGSTPWHSALRKPAPLNRLLTPSKYYCDLSFFLLRAASPQHAECCCKSNAKDSCFTHFSIKNRGEGKADVWECYTYLSKFSSSLLFLHSSMCNQIVKHLPYNSITRYINANFRM